MTSVFRRRKKLKLFFFIHYRFTLIYRHIFFAENVRRKVKKEERQSEGTDGESRGVTGYVMLEGMKRQECKVTSLRTVSCGKV